MKPIIEYEIINHGVEYSDYFQGCGIAFTEFADVATGIGETEREALDDALEQLAQRGWEIDKNKDITHELEIASTSNLIERFIQQSLNYIDICQDDYTLKFAVIDMKTDTVLSEWFDTEEESLDKAEQIEQEEILKIGEWPWVHVSVRVK